MVLVTGGAGYIGSHTCVELLEKGYEIVVVDSLVNSFEESLKRVEKITSKKIPFVKADIRDEEALEKVFSQYSIDSVIHFAGLKAVGESVCKPYEYYDNNINSTLTLLKVMKNHGVKKIVFSSSATVYSGDNEMPVNESSKTGNCTNPYGWTKFMNEQILSSFCISDPEFSVVLLRYFNPIGAHESGLIGEEPQGIPNNLMPYVTQVAIGKLKNLTVFGNDYDTHDGTGVRDYVHVCDLARAHISAVEYANKHVGCEIFNVGTGKGSSVLDIVKAFEKVNSVKVTYVIGPRRKGDLATVFADCNKAKRILGFETRYTLEDMCRSSWNWQNKNPEGFRKHS